MSYSVNDPCEPCVKKGQCTDRIVIRGAVQGIIHSMPFGVGHLGGGTVTMQCHNLEVKPAE